MSLFDEYPRPWRVVAEPRGGFRIIAANGLEVMDGVSLTIAQAQELCDIVNGLQRLER